MTFENTGFNKSIFNGNGLISFSGDLTLNSSGDACAVSLFNDDNNCGILFSGSKIYETEYTSRYLVGSYIYGLENSFEVISGPKSYDILVNSIPVSLGRLKTYTGDDTSFRIDTVGTVDLNYNTFGSPPNYQITDFISTTSFTDTLTGKFTNNGSKVFDVYSGECLSEFASLYLTSTTVSSDLNFYIERNSSVTGTLLDLPCRFYTNFGNIDKNIVISGVFNTGYLTLIDLEGPEICPNNYFSIYSSYINSNDPNFSFQVSLENVSGAGTYYGITSFSGYSSDTASGYITGSGYIFSEKSFDVTGYGISGAVVLNQRSTGQIQQFATGDFSFLYQAVGFGTATGIGYTGLASGHCPILLENTILDGSGSYIFSENFTGDCTNPFPLELGVANNATGAIYYNLPENEVTSDILYIGNQYFGIVYGFHYSSISGLSDYLNSNQSLHRVSASVSGSNTILLQNSEGYAGNFVTLDVDNDNDGNMDVSGPYLLGGKDLEYTGTLVGTDFTGNINYTHTNTGYYEESFAGYYYSSGSVPIKTRNFHEIWNLSSGSDYPNSINFLTNGFYTSDNNYLQTGSSQDNFLLQVDYTNYEDGYTDIAKLTISGIGSNDPKTIQITGTN